MNELIVVHAELLIEREMLAPLLQFCAHVTGDRAPRPEAASAAGRDSLVPHPGRPYVEYVRTLFAALKEEQFTLLRPHRAPPFTLSRALLAEVVPPDPTVRAGQAVHGANGDPVRHVLLRHRNALGHRHQGGRRGLQRGGREVPRHLQRLRLTPRHAGPGAVRELRPAQARAGEPARATADRTTTETPSTENDHANTQTEGVDSGITVRSSGGDDVDTGDPHEGLAHSTTRPRPRPRPEAGRCLPALDAMRTAA